MIMNEKRDKLLKVLSDNYTVEELQTSQIVATHFEKRKIKNPEKFSMIYLDFIYKFNRIASSSAKSIFLCLLENQQYENEVEINQNSIADILKYSRKTVNKAVNELCSYNIVLKFKDNCDKRRCNYIINPCASWRGSDENRLRLKKHLSRNDKGMTSLFNSVEQNAEITRQYQHELDEKRKLKGLSVKINNEELKKCDSENTDFDNETR